MPKQPGSSYGLTGYSWDDKLRNYRDNTTGRMVKRSDVADLLREVTTDHERKISEYGRMVANGDMTPRQFYEAMQQEIKVATNANAALAKGGWAQLTDADIKATEEHLRQENARMWQFAREIKDGDLSAAQIEARANLYANSTYGRYWEITTEEQIARGMNEERLVTSADDKVCEECTGEAGKGWQAIGTYYPPIHAGCRCEVEYRTS